MLRHGWGPGWLVDFGGSPPPNASQFLKVVRDLPLSLPLKCKATSPEPRALVTLSTGHSNSGTLPPAIVTPGPGTRQLGTAPVSQSSLTFILAHLKPIYSASSILPIETTITILAQVPASPSPTPPTPHLSISPSTWCSPWAPEAWHDSSS